MPPPLLFSEIDIHDVLREQKQEKQALKNAVASAPESFGSLSDQEVVDQFVRQFDIEIPALNESEMTMTEREVEIDVSGDPRRVFFDHSGPFYVKGTAVDVHIPFTGESIFFKVRPSTFSLSPPRGSIRGRELVIEFRFAVDVPPPDLKKSLHAVITDIKQQLIRLEESAKQLRAELPPLAAHAWSLRRAQFQNRAEVVASLGLPKRKVLEAPEAKPRIVRSQASHSKRATGSKDAWQVFISHASEDKESIAKPLAEALTDMGVPVWYDEYTLTLGDSLRRKIDEGLARSKFGIVILSPAFFEKHWPQQELNGLAAKEVNGVKVILPIWHNVSRADVAAQSPTLADRLAVSSSKGLDKIVEEMMRAMGIQSAGT